jgi:hypothetical protein
VGLKLLATLAATAALATPAGYLGAQQRPDGGFGDPQLTAWATLGLAAAGTDATKLRAAAGYLAQHEPREPTDVALAAMARTVAGDRPELLLARLRSYRAGTLVNATTWTILALRQAGEPAPPALVRSLLAAQRSSGGWSWHAGSAADTNDTAAAIQALLAAGRKPGAPAYRYLARLRRPDGSYRYSARYATTPVWVTAQVLPALFRKPFPLSLPG